MPNVNETVAGLTISAKTEGVDQAKKQVEGLTQATEQLGVASQTTSKSTLSLEDAWKRQTLRMDEAARAQANMARETKLADAALREGIATQAQHAQRLAEINQRYGQASVGAKAFAAATSGVSAQLVAMAAGAGPVGTFLAALGPWGFAASVGLGAVSAVLNRVVEGAERIGDKSIEMKKFSDVTGLSVTEIKGLTKAGAELGVSSDDITTSIERFSVGLFEARKGSGALFDQVNKINPALARQLAEAKGTAQGFDILAQAIKGATDAAQRNALARAAFGRGGIETGLVAAATVDKGGVAAMGEQIAKNTGLTQEWVRETARLRQENIELEKATTAAMDAAFALPVLQRQNEYLKTLKEIADLMIKGGGFKAPGADDPGAAFADYLSPPTAPLSQRGPSEGAMQAQQEAAAQREVTTAINEANKAREYAVSVEKMLVTIAQDTAAAEVRKAAVFAQNAATYSNVSATTAQTLAQLKDQLNVASAVGVSAQIEAQYRATINDLLRQGKSMTDAIAIAEAQRAIALAKIEAQHQVTMVSLQGQLAVAQQITGLGKINAQYEADINNLMMQGLNIAQATEQATMRRAIALAQVNTNAQRQLQTLKDENEVMRQTTELGKDRVRAEQEYQKLLKEGVSEKNAAAVRDLMLANADLKESLNQVEDATESWSVANDRAGESAQRVAANAKDVAYWAHQAASSIFDAGQAALIANTAFVPFATAWKSLGPSGLGTGGAFQGPQGLTQFKPGGYESTIANPLGTQTTDVDKWLTQMFDMRVQNAFAQAGGNPQAAVSSLISQGNIFTGGATDTSRLASITRLTDLMPEEQQIGSIRGLIGQLGTVPQTLQTAELTKQLNDKLTQLTDATKANTSATEAQTDVLSPFYSSDPRRTHLGFRAFAGGGIMTQYGELPLRQYQGGGMATSPQVAVFGEGSTPEAYVPVPSGRIPVEIKQPANSNQRPVNVTINVMGNADAGTVAALRQTSFQKAQQLRRVVG